MNRLIYTILLFFLSTHSIQSQTTYYYGLTKKIIDGKVSMSVSGGQFISFLNEICYESNKNSVGVGHGTLKLNKSYSDSRFKFYMGNSYWGDAATFKFKSDLSVLNVVLENGDVYVYKRQPAPSSVTTCSLIRKKGNSSSGGGSYNVPIDPNNGYMGGYTNSGSLSNSSLRQKVTAPRKQSTKHVCSRCHGQKRVVLDTYPALYGQSNCQVKCNECGGYFMRSTGHSHITCPQCHGRGYFTTD